MYKSVALRGPDTHAITRNYTQKPQMAVQASKHHGIRSVDHQMYSRDSHKGSRLPRQQNNYCQAQPKSISSCHCCHQETPSSSIAFFAASLCSFTKITCFDSPPCTGWGGISHHMSLVCRAGAAVKSPGAVGKRPDCSTWPGLQGFC